LLFRFGRARLLRTLAQRDVIYRTPHCRQRFEAQARRNLQHELEQLGRGR
jgi:predicted metal-dependent HD superfamily phosphohydrolase